LRVRPSNGFQSTVYAVPSSCLTTMIECGFLYSTLSTRPSTVMRLWNARGGARQKSLVRQGYRLPAGLEAGSATRAVALLSRREPVACIRCGGLPKRRESREALICRRHLRRLDHEGIDRASGRVESKTELLLKGRREGRPYRITYVPGKREFHLENAVQPRSIHHRTSNDTGQILR